MEDRMIARTWAGATRASDADAYLDYLHATGLAEYRNTPGNRGVLALRRIAGDRAEFLLVTLWDSDEAIRGFAGDDIERAVFYAEDDRYLVAREERVHHYEVVYQAEEATP
jgi:heme-degrading monooxygenase HmoA